MDVDGPHRSTPQSAAPSKVIPQNDGISKRRGYNTEAGDKDELSGQRKAQNAVMRDSRRRKEIKEKIRADRENAKREGPGEGISPRQHHKVVPDDSTNTMPLILRYYIPCY
ncbi:hypothetical protein C8J56DRAFT_1166445 [Mycena floridula]|nr:hypothetical protein C8J56DRAFT_1166445 [Mycena floridula]